MIFQNIPFDSKLQADSKIDVKILNQRKNDQVMDPQKGLNFEKKTCFSQSALPTALVLDMFE